MTEAQIMARAWFIAAGEQYNRARKAHGECRGLRRTWIKAKAACLAAGLPW